MEGAAQAILALREKLAAAEKAFADLSKLSGGLLARQIAEQGGEQA